ncbi:MAG TPA: TetR family transcriptional regulator [Acidimicrobiia bacterium]|nr:TetR family transcriptional regulator [Acidimicrobiia bacterium]
MAPTAPKTRQGEARRVSGAETRELLMDVAEELFAQLGVDAVSIRSINSAAGLAPAAVHYHFGSKDRLLREIVRRRGAHVVATQNALIDAIEREGRTPDAVELVGIMAQPFFDILDLDPVGGRRWIRLVGNLILTGDERLRVQNAVEGVTGRFERLVTRIYPDHSSEFVIRRWRMACIVLVQLLGTGSPPVADVQLLSVAERDVIIRFVAAGFDEICQSRSVSA